MVARALCAAAMQSPSLKRLEELFTAEPDRLSRLSFEIAGLYFDWSKTHLDKSVIAQSLARADKMGFAAKRDALFAGDIINPSEGRPATHVAERGSGAPDDVDLATVRRQRMRALVDAIEAGAFGDVTGILHIGIGGSVLGPALLVDALGRKASTFEVRFLSNIDGAAFDEFVQLSGAAWGDFETHFGARIYGLFAVEPQAAEIAAGARLLLLMTRYDDLSEWQRSRDPSTEAMKIVARRRELTRVSLARACVLIPPPGAAG